MNELSAPPTPVPQRDTIHRKHPESHFTILPNALLQDKTLSFRARGVLAMMLSMPVQWRTYHKWIGGQGTEGDEALRTAIRELEAAGYVTRRQRREAGVVRGFEWEWFAEPLPVGQRTNFRRTPKPEKPESGCPKSGEPATRKEPLQKEQRVQNNGPVECQVPQQAERSKGTFQEDRASANVIAPTDRKALTKDQLLELTTNPFEIPSAEEFMDYLRENRLLFVVGYRPHLFDELSNHKWCQWKRESLTWDPIRDWRRYMCALNDTIEAAYRDRMRQERFRGR